MSGASKRTAELVEHLLAGRGRVPFAWLLTAVLSVGELRDLAKKFGLSPKGIRVEKASADPLAALLAESTEPRVLDAACAAFLAGVRGDKPAAPAPATGDLTPMLRLKSEEVERAQGDLARAQEAVARYREREAEHVRALQFESERAARQLAEIEHLRRELSRSSTREIPVDQSRRIHDLERELEVLAEAEEGLRRRVAELTARNRALQEEVEDLAEKVPKGRRRNRVVPPPVEPVLFRLPYLTSGFYKSLEGKDRKSVERAVQAVLLLCTEGPGYPGLEVKQLEGQSLWSLRASLKLRVYFAYRDDGDVDVLLLADREDQHTTLRRLKER